MPGIVMFKRRWRIGSDDFVVPALAEFFLRLIWFIVALALFLKHLDHFKCSGERLLQTYLILSLAELGIILFLDALIAWISSRGTVTQTKPRRHLCKLLYLRLLVMIMEAALSGIGTKWAFTPEDHFCEPKEVVLFVQVIAILSWIALGAIILGIILVFDPLGSYRVKRSGHKIPEEKPCEQKALLGSSNRQPAQAEKVWEWQVRLLCCFFDHDEQSRNAYSDISKLLSYWFTDEDLVPSDVAAGLILVHQKQATEKRNKVSPSNHPEKCLEQSPESLTSTGAVPRNVISSADVLAPPANQLWMTPESACHYMKFALGSYGWPVFLFLNMSTGICQILKHLRCCCFKPASYIVDDNFCGCYTAVLKLFTGLLDEDLIYVSFHNRIYEIPFFVAVDHETCSVVVCLRGTLSLPDALTDISADCDKLFQEGCGQGLVCHKGMLRAAFFVKCKLDESQALTKAFSHHENYSLTITGHSLGAGVAVLLAVLLRPVYPNLRCYAFSPPGGLLHLEGVKEFAEDFIMSVVLGNDLVPRLSVLNVENMKKKLLDCISDCDQPKYKIFLSQLFGYIVKITLSNEAKSSSRPLLKHLNQTNSSGSYTTNSSQAGSSESGGQTEAHSRRSVPRPLHIPGRILHLSRVDSGFTGQWVTSDYFNEIIISPTMISDHMVPNVYNALKQLVNSSGNFP